MRSHLILPMGGEGSRFYKNGYAMPKPLIEIAGKPFFYWAAKSVVNSVELTDITFVVLRQHIERHYIDREIKRYFPQARIVMLEHILPGPVFTCLEGVKELYDDAPVIFNDCDHMFGMVSLSEALNSGCFDADGALLTFESSEPQFSYVQYDSAGHVTGTVEKVVVSNRAICGAYIFRNARVFRQAASKYIVDCPYNECFMSGLYNILCREGKKVEAHALDFHVEFGTPEEYEKAKRSPYFSILL